jgi:predicted enzyme related to lactoylglutathione lyase
MTDSSSAPATGPVVTFDCVALDCADPAGVAQFYADLLGGTVQGDDEGDWFDIVWDGPRIATQLAPNHESPDWPRGQQQSHLDFVVADIAAAHERVLALGGAALDPIDPPQPSPERGFRVYADPAGHPFCLCRPSKEAWG